MAVQTSAASATGESLTSYALDESQLLKASKALLTHIRNETKKTTGKTVKRSLVAEENSDEDDDNSEDVTPVWLNLATKQHITDKNRLKPSKIAVPHPLNRSENISICLITTDPQRAVKNALADPSFPHELSVKITKVIGLSKLAARYKTFETRRQLLSEHDVFLADDRIITRLPKVLGKTFYKGTAKRPIPLSISPRKSSEEQANKPKPKKKEAKEASVASPLVIAAEIERAIKCIPVSVRPGTNVSIRVGLETFTPQQLSENVRAVVPKVIEKHVVKGWRNVKSINIKSPTSLAVPIWLSDNLWADETNVKDNESDVQELAEQDSTDTKKRKRNADTTKGPQVGERKKAKLEAEKVAKEERKQRLAGQKAKAFESV